MLTLIGGGAQKSDTNKVCLTCGEAEDVWGCGSDAGCGLVERAREYGADFAESAWNALLGRTDLDPCAVKITNDQVAEAMAAHPELRELSMTHDHANLFVHSAVRAARERYAELVADMATE